MSPEPIKHQVLHRLTKAHYDAYPFEFLTPEDEVSIRRLQPHPFLHFVETFARRGMDVAEVGCGPGRGTMYLKQRGLNVTALDLSGKSLALARARAPEAYFVQGDNLGLPFRDASFDIVVSDGVIHHTADASAAFAENVRILKRGGYLYLAVYDRHRYYYYIYAYLGSVVRLIEKTQVGRILVYSTLFPLYYAVHLVKSRGKRTLLGARNFFYDYVITPRASFHTRDEIQAWGAKGNLELLLYDPTLGNVHVAVFRKN